jgi:uncharacterized metal-binding protein YceD (DUF177 family)
MGNPLRDRRTPLKLAASGQVIELSDKIGDFERLTAIIEADLAALNPDKLPSDWRDAVVSGQLVFGFTDAQEALRPEGRWPATEGHVEVTINMVCQRCLEPFRLPLVADFRLLFAGDQADTISGDRYEVWELAEELLRPLDLVEEVLIMAMPLAARHVDDAACKEPIEIDEGSDDITRPFADLKSQMQEKS